MNHSTWPKPNLSSGWRILHYLTYTYTPALSHTQTHIYKNKQRLQMQFILYKSNWEQSNVYAQMIKNLNPKYPKSVSGDTDRDGIQSVCTGLPWLPREWQSSFFYSLCLAEFSKGCKCDPSKKECSSLDVVTGKLGAGNRKRVMLFSAKHSPLFPVSFFFLSGLSPTLFLKR